jgi:poly(3-hydroxybutyrate) depolymerase
MDTQQQTGSWVESMANNRAYSTYLPDGYDPARAYPVILLLHGCGSGTNNLPMERETGSDAIVVRGTGSRDDGCWLDGATGNDMDYIDAMLEDVKSRFCADVSQFFAVGYSSGSWVVNQLSCVRSDVFLGLASVTGGEPPLGDCDGPVARMFVHDRDDTSNLIAWSESARERMLDVNECSDETMPVEPSPCVSHQGCSEGHPVIWCETTGEGHNRQDNFAAPAFWDFFQELGAN